ncbi:actin-like protein Arp6 [Epithele typhae]|uniref:actin-like protein Arp6 n=1 Tax=Epithele typhae TaxID=378194 RepID=UPI0020085AB6|nr:actin-like protein Arp6 [Epithele typhae]KAH9924346.1 actin-like protein Arp6 [Epithele typhae]
MPPKRNIVILDNGASTIKAGVLGVHDKQPRVISNAVVREKGDKATYVGHELTQCQDFTSLRFRLPFEKGFLVDWDAQKAIWDGLLSNEVNTSESSLLITEPYFNLPNVQDVYDQFVFEEYDFRSYYRCTPASLIPYGRLLAQPKLPAPECVLVIDSGFSFTHVVPVLKGTVVWEAVKRIDVGGKLLTNHLKETVSYRQWNMMEETHIMNEIKEACCFVSENLRGTLKHASTAQPTKNHIVQEYVFPDYSAHKPGRIRQPGEALSDAVQTLVMNNERFTVPEILFHPTDIGLGQTGLSGTVASSIALLPEDLQGLFWANIALVGGNTALPGFRNRLMAELRALAPVDCEVVAFASDEPTLEAYRAAVAFARRPEFAQCVVTREDYLEMGSAACRRRFADWKPAEREAAPARPRTQKGRADASSGGARTDSDSDGGDANSPAPTTAKKPGRGRGRGRGAARRGA